MKLRTYKYNLSKTLSPHLIQDFYSYAWPGNIRELINTLERIIITTQENVVRENPITSANNIPESSETENKCPAGRQGIRNLSYSRPEENKKVWAVKWVDPYAANSAPPIGMKVEKMTRRTQRRHKI